MMQFPIGRCWPYLTNSLKEKISHTLGGRKLPAIWGPRIKDIEGLLGQQSLEEVCARQWLSCINNSLDGLKNLKVNQDLIHVNYETLVTEPRAELHRISDFIGVNPKPIIRQSKTIVKQQSGWETKMSRDKRKSCLAIMKPGLQQLGYI